MLETALNLTAVCPDAAAAVTVRAITRRQKMIRDIQDRIIKLKAEKDICILAHSY
ncbi:MAG: hypothetical protein ACOYIB_01655 [Desulfosporosinus sp.]